MSALAHGAIVFASLLVYVLVTRIGRHRRHPSAAVAWVLLIAMLPYVGLPLFLLFGTRKIARPGLRGERISGAIGGGPTGLPSLSTDPSAPFPTSSACAPLPWDGRAAVPARWAMELLAAMKLPAPVDASPIEFHANGARSFTVVLELIRSAKRAIDVCTYILGRDEVGDRIVAELVGAAERGVRVRLMLDAYGSLRTSQCQRLSLAVAGAELRFFMPFLHNPRRGRTNLRNHRKLIVADGERWWSGGRNLAAEYFLDRPGHPAWADLTFAGAGAMARQMATCFERDWAVSSGRGSRSERIESLRRPEDAVDCGRPGSELGRPAGGIERPRLDLDLGRGSGQDPRGSAQLVASGPDFADDTVYSLLLTAAYHAERRLLAVSPYFVPDEALLAAWCMAARRGVRVTLLMPARSNHRLPDLARSRALRSLVEAGGCVMVHPAMIHAKAVVVDESIALCGTVNLDGRSLFLNYELMVAFYGRAEIDWLADWIDARVGESSVCDTSLPPWWRDLLEGMVRAVGYQL